jgi:hypothetical protein
MMGTIATAVVAGIALVLSAGALITSAGAATRTAQVPPADPPGVPSAPETVAVELVEFAIAPSDITIAAGGRCTSPTGARPSTTSRSSAPTSARRCSAPVSRRAVALDGLRPAYLRGDLHRAWPRFVRHAWHADDRR